MPDSRWKKAWPESGMKHFCQIRRRAGFRKGLHAVSSSGGAVNAGLLILGGLRNGTMITGWQRDCYSTYVTSSLARFPFDGSVYRISSGAFLLLQSAGISIDWC
jgi:hypothetical protein